MSNTKSLIEQFYQEEQQRRASEATFTSLDLLISAADMAMLSTISRRFNRNKEQFARDALSNALIDMFSALEPGERKMIAKEADELANSIAAEIAEEQGLKKFDVTGTNWVNQDKTCVREERKMTKQSSKDGGQAEEEESTPVAETSMAELAKQAETVAVSAPQNNSIFADM
ncbi:MAG: hypothetical protein H7A09_08945 [Oceanospirillaceae bacterium]|nr:hypothetical protein [Oceanospirillaceae bacterium]MCP5335307.1 hypothetical protein [Oceanospirillaceae bacterium]MCP5350740.1 hypothetical protein [Oceanospirillaceae bacterium]